MSRIAPKDPTCRRGHPRDTENTRWFRHPNGKEYAACRACARASRPSKALSTEERERRRNERARAHLAAVLVRYTIDHETGCWMWAGALDSWGYGHVYDRMAHRVFYEQLVGPIPEGKELDHLCGNRPCVNPAHLEPVTPAQNSRRSRQCRLSAADADEIRRLVATGKPKKQVARTFGVSAVHVRRICEGRAWRPAGG